MRPAWLLCATALAGAVACLDDEQTKRRGGPDDDPPAARADAGTDSDASDDAGPPPEPYVWNLPPGFPEPVVPADNPMSAAKVALGRHLFYDARLSRNGSQSCASCHEQERAFTDGLAVAVGSTGEAHPRNSMSLANVAYSATLNWANPVIVRLEDQALIPLFGTQPIELGWNGGEDELLAALRLVPEYQTLFPAAFGSTPDPFTMASLVRALASFQRTLVSGRAPYDRFITDGDATAISDSAKRGLALFNSERLECFHCHSGFALQDSVAFVGKAFVETPFHNTGLYNIDGAGAYPEPNVGIFEFSHAPRDMGRFRVPTLRNVAITAPYMHDGSAATLDDVIDHYAAAGRTIASGPNAGVGSSSPLKSGFLVGFTLTADERADLKAFLESLTDEEFLNNPALANPWPDG